MRIELWEMNGFYSKLRYRQSAFRAESDEAVIYPMADELPKTGKTSVISGIFSTGRYVGIFDEPGRPLVEKARR